MAMALRRFVMRGLDSYRKKYIEKDSIQPLYHVLYGGMISSYLIALPYERRRLGYEETDNVFRFAFLEVNDVPSMTHDLRIFDVSINGSLKVVD